MSQWISLEEAADKYRLDEEYIWLWEELREIAVTHKDNGVFVDEESLQKFIERTKKGITSEYVNALEQLCIEKTKSCQLYLSLLGMYDKEATLEE